MLSDETKPLPEPMWIIQRNFTEIAQDMLTKIIIVRYLKISMHLSGNNELRLNEFN